MTKIVALSSSSYYLEEKRKSVIFVDIYSCIYLREKGNLTKIEPLTT